MNRSFEVRLDKLEVAARAGRTFVLWDKSALVPHFDLETEKRKFQEERGITPADTMIIVRWRNPKSPDLLL